VGSEKVVALQDINMEIYKGEFCCFLGTSGSGKSTLLNVLAGLEKPTRGSIKIKNVNIEKLNEKNLRHFDRIMLALYFRHTILSVIWTLLKMSAFLSCSKAYPKRKGRKELLSF